MWLPYGGLAEGAGEKWLWLGLGGEPGRKRKCLDYTYIFKVEPLGFADKVVMGCKRKQRVKNDSKVLGLSIWKNGVAIN